jgi:hypothetical protein
MVRIAPVATHGAEYLRMLDAKAEPSITALLADDAQFVDELTGGWVRGRQAIGAALRSIFSRVSDVHSVAVDMEANRWGDVEVETFVLSQVYDLDNRTMHVESPTTLVWNRTTAGWRLAVIQSVAPGAESPAGELEAPQPIATVRLYRAEDEDRVRELLGEGGLVPAAGEAAAAVWEAADGHLVGVVHGEAGAGRARLRVDPAWRHLEPAMLDWAEVRLAATDKAGGHTLELSLAEEDALLLAELEGRGYRRADGAGTAGGGGRWSLAWTEATATGGALERREIDRFIRG